MVAAGGERRLRAGRDGRGTRKLQTGPKFEDHWPDAEDVKFDDSVGVMIEGGWNWVGLQCTCMEYKSSAHGTFDASNCGVRFMFRFPRWRPVKPPGPG